MHDGMRLTDHAKKIAAKKHAHATLTGSLTRALAIASGFPVEIDDGYTSKVAELVALLGRAIDQLPQMMAWCAVKHYHGHVPGDSWEPIVWAAFLSKEQAVTFAPAIEKAYWRKHREDNDRWLVERRPAELSDFIAPTVTAKEYAAEIKRYVDVYG